MFNEGKKMKLAMMGTYPVDGNINIIKGGLEAVVVNMVKGLARYKDIEMHIITASHCIDRNKDIALNGINIHAVPLDRKLGNITFYSNVIKRFHEKIKEIAPDVIHTHELGYYTLAALSSGHKRVVISTHGIANTNKDISCDAVDKIRRYLRYRIYIKCLKMAENIIVNSPYTKEYILRLGKKKIYELDNPVSDVFFNINNKLEEERRILFVGHICEAKGIMTSLQSLNTLKEIFKGIKLILAGPIVDCNFYLQAIRYVEKNRLDNIVNFLGQLDEARLKEEYDKAAIVILPSNQDVAPLAILQAMAAGKAIVASNVGGIPYIIDDGINGFLIAPKNHIVLAEKISSLIGDADLRRKFGDNAMKKVLGRNRINIITDKLYKIYEEVANIC